MTSGMPMCVLTLRGKMSQMRLEGLDVPLGMECLKEYHHDRFP